MKKVIYTRADGCVTIVTPVEGGRLANWITLEGGQVVPAINPPQRVDSILRGWPVQGATADWAETEDQFVARILADPQSVPVSAINPQIVEASAIPADRSKRNAWRQVGAAVVVDAAAVTACKDAAAIRAIDGIDRLQFEHLFDIENWKREKDGLAPITKAQYRNALINRWKELNP